MKKVELLAPAGGYETMVGAFNAGADAVYLGGSKFGARAYAENFDREQVLDAISYAHLHGKKIYMTVNTLVKEREYAGLYDFLLPFAEKMLDGVIVQDMGVMKLIRDEFPKIELHGSTQQTVTGVHGARLLKELGCVRVVPARELSLKEMKDIREMADIEVEAFIHGAMCYCYSGMCLFSSMVGTRSGNRGRCAQPCRLPYSLSPTDGRKEQYPLSLKDMCTVDIIPELIEAGIDSFKIEGRMKKPEYAAGVTHIYRKYIDLYYKEPYKKHDIAKEDMEVLKSLYLRSEVCSGYYYMHNGKSMITLDSPAYNGSSDRILSDIREKYISNKLKLKCSMLCRLRAGEEALLQMRVHAGDKEVTKEVRGAVVEKASKRPMDEESAIKQLARLGNTPFEADEIKVEIDDGGSNEGIFIPVSELNELRRRLCEIVENELAASIKIIPRIETEEKGRLEEVKKERQSPDIHVLVNTREQLDAALKYVKNITRLYVSSSLFLQGECDERLKGCPAEVFAALPYITRREEYDAAREIEKLLGELPQKGVSGFLVRNLEQLGLLHEKKYQGKVISDYGLYVWNVEAAAMLRDQLSEISLPLELTIHEAKEVAVGVKNRLLLSSSLNIYGYTPMMVSAGCVKKTLESCSGYKNKVHSEELSLYDRKGNELKVTTDCLSCSNIIWNAHPTSLHGKLGDITKMEAFDHYRIDLSVETGALADKILGYYTARLMKESTEEIFDNMQYTTGHYKRGVE